MVNSNGARDTPDGSHVCMCVCTIVCIKREDRVVIRLANNEQHIDCARVVHTSIHEKGVCVCVRSLFRFFTFSWSPVFLWPTRHVLSVLVVSTHSTHSLLSILKICVLTPHTQQENEEEKGRRNKSPPHSHSIVWICVPYDTLNLILLKRSEHQQRNRTKKSVKLKWLYQFKTEHIVCAAVGFFVQFFSAHLFVSNSLDSDSDLDCPFQFSSVIIFKMKIHQRVRARWIFLFSFFYSEWCFPQIKRDVVGHVSLFFVVNYSENAGAKNLHTNTSLSLAYRWGLCTQFNWLESI